ncbi:hypothetical protein ACG9Y2_19150, partial [Acinetobacter baumannii]
MKSTAFNHAAWNPLHSIGFNFFTLNGIQCMQSRSMDSTAYTLDPLSHNEWNPLYSMTLHGIHCGESGC